MAHPFQKGHELQLKIYRWHLLHHLAKKSLFFSLKYNDWTHNSKMNTSPTNKKHPFLKKRAYM
jgi:hypothetical protein